MCNCHTYREAGIRERAEDIDPLYCCDDCCAMGKKLRPSELIDKDLYYLGQYWASDWSGEKVPSAVKGYKYAGVFVERKSRLKESYFAVNKDAPTVCQIVKDWDREHLSRWKYHYLVVRQLENFFFHLKVDNLEFRFPEVLELLYNIGVRPHFTCPGHSSENGLAERAIGVVDTRERTFRIAENKPDDFWAFSWRLATQISNILPYQYRGRWHLDPYHHYFGKPFGYKRLKKPLQKCFVLMREREKTREVIKSYLSYFIGYSNDSNAYEIYIPATGTLTTSGDIYFPKATGSLDEEEEEQEEVSDNSVSLSTSSSTTAGESPQPSQAQEIISTAGESSTDRFVDRLYITDWEAWFRLSMKLLEKF